MNEKVLIVEDDPEIRNLLGSYLEQKNMSIVPATDGKEALEYIESDIFDIILLDMMLPKHSGDEIITRLRERKEIGKSHTPVIVISAKSGLDTRLDVMEKGADDYIVKPFDLEEVYVRIRALLRRSPGGAYSDTNKEDILKYGDLVFDKEKNMVTFKSIKLKLTSKEMKLLEMFLRNPGTTFSKQRLYETVWEETYYYEDNTINVHMSNLRKKLSEATGVEVIETVWGIGYRLFGGGK